MVRAPGRVVFPRHEPSAGYLPNATYGTTCKDIRNEMTAAWSAPESAM